MQSDADIVGRAVDYFLKHGVFEIRKQLFPDGCAAYWEQGVDRGFEHFYTGLDPANKVRYMQRASLK